MQPLEQQTNPRYAGALAFLYFLSPLFFIGSVIPLETNIFLAIPLAGLMSLPFLFLYDRSLSSHRLALPVRLILMIAAVFLGISGLYYFSRFVKICVMPDTPVLFLPAALLLFSAWAALKDIHVLERFSRIAAPIVLTLMILSVLSGALKIEPHFLEIPRTAQFFDFGFLSLLWLTFGLYLIEGLILITLLRQQFKVRDFSGQNKKPPAVFRETAKGLILSSIILSAAYLITTLVLGPDVFELLTYPLYYPPGLTQNAEYLERIEVLLLAVFLFSEFLRAGIFLMLLKEGIHAIYTAFGDGES